MTPDMGFLATQNTHTMANILSQKCASGSMNLSAKLQLCTPSTVSQHCFSTHCTAFAQSSSSARPISRQQQSTSCKASAWSSSGSSPIHSTSSSRSARPSLVKCEARKREIEVVPFSELYDSVLEAVIADEKPLIKNQMLVLVESVRSTEQASKLLALLARSLGNFRRRVLALRSLSSGSMSSLDDEDKAEIDAAVLMATRQIADAASGITAAPAESAAAAPAEADAGAVVRDPNEIDPMMLIWPRTKKYYTRLLQLTLAPDGMNSSAFANELFGSNHLRYGVSTYFAAESIEDLGARGVGHPVLARIAELTRLNRVPGDKGVKSAFLALIAVAQARGDEAAVQSTRVSMRNNNISTPPRAAVPTSETPVSTPLLPAAPQQLQPQL